MHGVIVQAFAERIRAGLMELEQVPQAYQAEVQTLIDKNEESDGA